MEAFLWWVKPLYFVLLAAFLGVVGMAVFSSPVGWGAAALVMLPFVALGLYDVVQQENVILRNFPVIGHVRFLAEDIAPEIQQYFIERHTDGTPINRNHRRVIYARAEGREYKHPFGTELLLNGDDYRGLAHRVFPVDKLDEAPRVEVGGASCAQPYSASLINVSAMSYGSLGPTAVESLSGGARIGGFALNTGEGGVAPYHLNGGGDLIWQIGTGYFGARGEDGGFDAEAYEQNATRPEVKMIELKLSQGAKPGHGGILPAKKNNDEIAAIRGVEAHTDVLSPPGHRAFDDAEGMMRFVARLRDLSGGKPVGIKLCLGREDDFQELCRAMKATGECPDFITVDGAEGGTGAAPLEYSDSVGMPLRRALPIVHAELEAHGLRDRIRVVASGKVLTSYDVLEALALGADLVNMARAFMLSIGCIQAQRCDTNACPGGIATMDPRLYKAVVPTNKREKAANFHRLTLQSVLGLSAAAGVRDPRTITMDAFTGAALPDKQPSRERVAQA